MVSRNIVVLYILYMIILEGVKVSLFSFSTIILIVLNAEDHNN